MEGPEKANSHWPPVFQVLKLLGPHTHTLFVCFKECLFWEAGEMAQQLWSTWICQNTHIMVPNHSST